MYGSLFCSKFCKYPTSVTKYNAVYECTSDTAKIVLSDIQTVGSMTL